MDAVLEVLYAAYASAREERKINLPYAPKVKKSRRPPAFRLSVRFLNDGATHWQPLHPALLWAVFKLPKSVEEWLYLRASAV